MTRGGTEIVAEVRCDPAAAQVFEHGWQSWSPTALYPLTARPARPRRTRWETLCYRPGVSAPAGAFQGEGLLALVPGDGTVRMWAAPRPDRSVLSIGAGLDGDRVLVRADGDVEEFVYHHDHLGTALGAWAEEVAARVGVPELQPVPPAWCSWYCYWGEVTQADIEDELELIEKLDLGVRIVVVDDGHQAEIGDWTERSGRFGPLAEMGSRIREAGKRMGVWTAPFLVGAKSRVAREHPEWLVGDGFAGHHWDQDLHALDVTHPEAADHLVEVFRRFRREGCDFFKIDFLYAGALEGRRHGDASGIDAYREGLRLIRAGVGPDATLLGCGAPILPSIGLVDAMRTSPDTGPRYEPRDDDLSQPAVRSALLTGRARAWTHGRWWVHDPDCLIVRPEVERREVWARHVEGAGGFVSSSDPLDALDEWGLETTRRLLRPATTQPLRGEGTRRNMLGGTTLEPGEEEEP